MVDDLDPLTEDSLRHAPHPRVSRGWAQQEQLLAQTPEPSKGCRSGGGGRSVPAGCRLGAGSLRLGIVCLAAQPGHARAMAPAWPCTRLHPSAWPASPFGCQHSRLLAPVCLSVCRPARLCDSAAVPAGLCLPSSDLWLPVRLGRQLMSQPVQRVLLQNRPQGRRLPQASRECIPLRGGSAGPAQPGPEGSGYASFRERPGPLGPAADSGLVLGGGKAPGARGARAQLPGQPQRPRRWPLHLEVQDDGPDQAEGQLGVAIRDVIIPDVHQLHLRASGLGHAHPRESVTPRVARGGWGRPGAWGRGPGQPGGGSGAGAASPGGVEGSPGRSAHSAACGSASSPSPGAVRRHGQSAPPEQDSLTPAAAAPPHATPEASVRPNQGSPPAWQQPLPCPQCTLSSWKPGPRAQRPGPTVASGVQRPDPGSGQEGRGWEGDNSQEARRGGQRHWRRDPPALWWQPWWVTGLGGAQAAQQVARHTAICPPPAGHRLGRTGHRPEVSWAPASGSHVPPWPAGTTTHRARAPDYVPLSWLPGQSRTRGKGQRSRFRVQAAEKPKQSRA